MPLKYIYKKPEITVSLVAFIFAFLLFFFDSKAFTYSLFAALLLAALTGFTWMVIKWIIKALE
jgi:uncharacterized membrane-anchored protein